MYYSPSTGGFYLPALHAANMPADVVPITVEEHAELLAGQSAGRRIWPRPDGRPVLVEQVPAAPRPPTSVALWQFRRELRARGWWDQVQAAIAKLPAEARADVEEWLEYGTEVQRASPLLEGLAAAIGVSDKIDDAFRSAAARTL